MEIRATDVELDISGSPAELNAIADQIERLDAGEELFIAADGAADPRPYERCLAELLVRVLQGPVCISVLNDQMVATRSQETMRVFAANLRFEPETRPKYHHHFEWFEGNELITRDSRPIVITAW